MAYQIHYGRSRENSVRLEMWQNVLEMAKTLSESGIAFDVINPEEYDFASESGVKDGLTDTEREQIEAVR